MLPKADAWAKIRIRADFPYGIHGLLFCFHGKKKLDLLDFALVNKE